MTDADPEYRRTKLYSGILPPGAEATHAGEPPRGSMRYAKTAVKPDMRISVDFLTCEQRCSVQDIISAIRIGKAEVCVTIKHPNPKIIDGSTKIEFALLIFDCRRTSMTGVLEILLRRCYP